MTYEKKMLLKRSTRGDKQDFNSLEVLIPHEKKRSRIQHVVTAWIGGQESFFLTFVGVSELGFNFFWCFFFFFGLLKVE